MTDEPLSGYVFVFTGNMAMERDEAKGRALLLGARVTAAVSSKTTHLVAGVEPGPSKVQKARELNIKILDEDGFMDIIEKYKSKMGKSISTAAEPKNETHQVRNKSEPASTEAWAEKYRPKNIEDLVGNRLVIEQLSNFVLGKTEFKAALISGSPGVGKTTAALVVCRQNNILPIEFNASDLRSKKSISEHISNVINNFAISKDLQKGRRVIIMDEVDGMTIDRGGIPELVSLIKKTKTPIVCICNDKTHPKMRTLASHCLDLHFRKLDARSILPRVKYILEKEGKHLSDGVLYEIIMNSNGDLRYVLNTVQNIVSKSTVNMESIGQGLVKKNILKGTFEIAAELFQKRTVADKTNLYFEDNSLMPLFVQENYLKCTFRTLKDLVISAESISFSDILDARIHGSEQEWSLMPYHAFYSVVYPLNNRTLQKRLDFPLFLGQNSKMNKNSRLLDAIASHFTFKTTRKEFRMVLAHPLYSRFIDLLGNGKVDDCIRILEETELLKEDMMNIGEALGLDILKAVNTKYKTALTREYKKLDRILPYNTSNIGEEEPESDD